MKKCSNLQLLLVVMLLCGVLCNTLLLQVVVAFQSSASLNYYGRHNHNIPTTFIPTTMTKLRYKNSDNNNNNNNNNEQDNDNNDDDGSSLLTKVKKEALPAEGDIPILSKINGNNKEHHNNQHRTTRNFVGKMLLIMS